MEEKHTKYVGLRDNFEYTLKRERELIKHLTAERTRAEKAEAELDDWRNQVEVPSSYKLRNNQLMLELEKANTRADKLQEEFDALKIAHEQAGIEAFKVTMSHKDRADLNERALELACEETDKMPVDTVKQKMERYRKLAERETK